MIQINNISKSYGNLHALSEINLTLDKGGVVGLLGVNGAGKSTLMKILSGILIPDKGYVTVYGYNILDKPSDAKKLLGYLSEDNPLYDDMYVKEYLHYVSSVYGNKGNISINDLLMQVGLETECRKKIKTLSKGNRQRVGVAQALIHNPSFLILDEPTSGLDPNQRESLNKLFVSLSKEKVVLLSTHILQDVRDYCSRVILIDQGQIIVDRSKQSIGSVEDIFQQLSNENNSR